MPSEYLQVARYHARQLEELLEHLRDTHDEIAEPIARQTLPILDLLTHAQVAIAALIVELESPR